MLYCENKSINKSNKNDSNRIRGSKVYKDKEERLMLAELCSKLDSILVNTSRHSSCPVSHYLLTISTTDYYSNENINNFDLRRLFYSRQHFKSHCHSSTHIDYK